jgi:hypothetical protein
VTIRMEREGENVWLTAPPYRKDQAKQIPGGRHDPKRQQWKYPLSWAVCVIGRAVFGASLEVGPELAEWAFVERERVAAVLEARQEAMEVE